MMWLQWQFLRPLTLLRFSATGITPPMFHDYRLYAAVTLTNERSKDTAKKQRS